MKSVELLTNSLKHGKRKNSDFKYIVKSLGLKHSRCRVFIPSSKKVNDKIVCGCGRPEELHLSDAIDEYNRLKESNCLPKEWDAEQHTIDDQPSDFGLMNFVDTRLNLAKFVRVSTKTEIQSLLTLLFSTWKLSQPDLLISVTGGAKNFNLNLNIRNSFRKGLVKTALRTNAWIITGGTQEGIMKEVGEAVKDVTTLDPKKKIILVGIANWSTVTNSHLLSKNDGNGLVEYTKAVDLTNLEQKFKTKHTSLDPNHNHFILVDNQKLNNFGGEIELRGQLESAISLYNLEPEKKKEKIPIVVLVVGGGPKTFEYVLKSVQENSPCIFFENSGRCSNVFTTACKLSEANKDYKTDPEFKAEIMRQLKINLNEKKDEHETLFENVLESLNYKELLSTFSFENGSDIEDAILNSIINLKNSQKDQIKEIFQKQLQLALDWDRYDIADRFILKEQILDTSVLQNFMYIAISKNKIEFVKSFLDHGLVLSKFLTHRRLIKLYNDIPVNSPLYFCIMQRKRNKYKNLTESDTVFSFKDVGRVIQKLLDNFFEHKFNQPPFKTITTGLFKRFLDLTSTQLSYTIYPVLQTLDMGEPCENPEHELFMYSVLTKRPEMAKYFLKEGINEICSALVASKIFKSYSMKFEESGNEYRSLADEFEQIAIDMLQMAFETNPDKAKFLLMREIPEFGNSTCLSVAKISHDQAFLSHNCVQELLMRLWYNKISTDTSITNITLSMVFPFLAPFFCIYREREISKSSDDDDVDEPTELDSNGLQSQKKKILTKQNSENKVKKSPSYDIKIKNRIDLDADNEQLNYLMKVFYFFTAPIVKFAYDKLLYILFLLLFSYVILCDFYPISMKNKNPITHLDMNVSLFEVILIVWISSFVLEKFQRNILQATSLILSHFNLSFFKETKLIKTKLVHFFGEFWNLVEFIAIIIFFAGTILRFIPNSPNCYKAARIILCFDVILWYFKSLHSYTCFKTMGPKLVMIGKMMIELLSFVLLVLVFMFGFGVSTQALMYHNVALNPTLLKNVLFPAYFIIGGEFYTREKIMGAQECTPISNTSITDIYTNDDCPEVNGANVTLVIYTIYLIFLDILLVNLLIAIFSNTYSAVEEMSDQIWKFQRYSLTYEYFHKSTFVPPFILINLFSFFLMFIARFLRGFVLTDLKPSENFMTKMFFYFYRQKHNGFKIYIENPEIERGFISWESQMADELFANEEKKRKEKIEFKLQENINKIDNMNKYMSSLNEKKEVSLKKIGQLDLNLDRFIEIFNKRKSNQLSEIKTNKKS